MRRDAVFQVEVSKRKAICFHIHVRLLKFSFGSRVKNHHTRVMVFLSFSILAFSLASFFFFNWSLFDLQYHISGVGEDS